MEPRSWHHICDKCIRSYTSLQTQGSLWLVWLFTRDLAGQLEKATQAELLLKNKCED